MRRLLARRVKRACRHSRTVKLIYGAFASLDGYLADKDGNFDWAEPDEEVHAFVNDVVRPSGTHLYGRRIYEVMAVWETDPSLAAHSPVYRDFAEIWQAAEKSSIRKRSRRYPQARRGSNGTSIQTRSGR